MSYNFRHRFTPETIDAIFAWILDEAGSAGALTPAAVFIDETHIKANASLKKKIKQEVPVAAKRYREELLAEVNADREAHGKKPLDDEDEAPKSGGRKKDNTSRKKQGRRKKEAKKQKTVTVSTTDPECGLFHKGEHKRCFAYEAHTACDKNGYVLAAVVTLGNVHDSVAFDDVYDKLLQSFPEVKTIVADAAYKMPHICRKVFRDGRVLSTAYKRPQTMKGGHPWWTYVYDEYYDCVICPEYQVLSYRTTNRDGYREYCSDPKICTQCPTRHLCTRSKNCVKTVLRHIWKDYEELADDARYTPEYADLYALRKETIERVFADAKEKHAMRYTFYRGLTQVSNWVRLKFAAMNLKKLAKWKARSSFSLSFFLLFPGFYFYNSLRLVLEETRQAAFRQAEVCLKAGFILITDKSIKNPRSPGNVRDKFRHEGTNGKAETIHNLIQGSKDLIFKAQFPDFFPNLFDGIHFRGIGRNVKQDNIFRNVQHFRFMPGSTITAEQNDIVRELVGQFP